MAEEATGGGGGAAPNFLDSVLSPFKDPKGDWDWNAIKGAGGVMGALGGVLGIGGSSSPPTGYQGSIPKYVAARAPVQNTYDPNRVAGSSGQRYFTDTAFSAPSNLTDTRAVLEAQAQGLAAANRQNPARQVHVPEAEPFASGGIAQLNKGRYLQGDSDGMADELPARIDGQQEARLSDGEFVIPADIVSHLGNGNSEAGAKQLYAMMDRIRKARTGNSDQGAQIDPKRFMP